MEPESKVEMNDQARQELPRSQPRVVRSEELLRGAREVLIAHHDQVYRLRETRNGKLILGK